MTIEVENISRCFDGFAAVDELSLTIAGGELLALLGPSGSGKTTLLRLIAGLDFPDRGRIVIDGADATHLPAGQRRIGFVFQHYALFRHMTVHDNIDFGMRVMDAAGRPHIGERRARVERLLVTVQLEGLGGRYPSQLSGGQRQRVALARALAIEPRVLLLDEPFGALDAAVRRGLRRWLRQLHAEIPVTTVFVTHDQEEALEVADRVVVMNAGRIEQTGTPVDVEASPATPFMHAFLGSANRFPVEVTESRVSLRGTPLRPGVARLRGAGDGPGEGFVRAHDLLVLPADAGNAHGRATVRHVLLRGGSARVELAAANGQLLEADLPRGDWSALGLAPGAVVGIGIRRMDVFPA